MAILKSALFCAQHFLRNVYCRWIATVFFAFSLALGAQSVPAIAGDSLEYTVKGAYLYKFGAFVDWPPTAFPDTATPFIIGILGDDPFGPKLDALVKNRTVHGRPIVVKRYQRAEQAKEAHVLYISPTEAERRDQIVAGLKGTSTLTVSDESKDWMGIINFIVQDNKVRFEIDPEAANRAGLKISSKLLSVADVVNNEKR